MKLKKWRKQNKLSKITVPSGLEFRGRKVRPQTLAFSGKMPVPLLTELSELGDLAKQNGDVGPDQLAGHVGAIGEMVGVICDDCLVEVLDEDEDDDGEDDGKGVWVKLSEVDFVPSRDLDETDQAYVFQWASREVEKLRPFRKK